MEAVLSVAGDGEVTNHEADRSPAGVVMGSSRLPAGFDHPHASEEARQIAEAGTVLSVQVGSGVHGTAVGGQGTTATR